jgi:hypothetical protein
MQVTPVRSVAATIGDGSQRGYWVRKECLISTTTSPLVPLPPPSRTTSFPVTALRPAGGTGIAAALRHHAREPHRPLATYKITGRLASALGTDHSSRLPLTSIGVAPERARRSKCLAPARPEGGQVAESN